MDWITVTVQALQDLWVGIVKFIPAIVGAVVVFVIGWFISVLVGKLITEVLKKAKFNKVFEKGNWKSAFDRAGIKVDASGFVGAVVKWVLVIVFLLAAADILGLSQFAAFLTSVLLYLPNVVVAALIFVATAIVSDIVEKLIRAAVESTKVGYGGVVSLIVKWSIWVFAILAILAQLKIEAADWLVNLLGIAFTGIVAMLAIAFGLGGKEVAAEFLQDLKKKLRE